MVPVFNAFSKKVAYMGPAGSGQTGKLINNALLMMNQANVQDVLHLAQVLRTDIGAMIDLLLAGTGASFALEALRGAVNTANAEHLKVLQILDMDIFRDAMEPVGPLTSGIYARAIQGAEGLPEAAQIAATAKVI